MPENFNFTIPQKPLVAALSRVQNVAAARSTMPILSCVLLEPLANVLRITATDLELGYTTAIDNIVWNIDPDQEFRLALSAKKLFECAKAIPTSEIHVAVDLHNYRVTLSGGTVSFTLAGQDPDEYPTLPQVEGQQFDLDAAALLQIINSVNYAQCKVVQKYNLCGCFLKIEENEEEDLFFTAVATDGHRIAVDSAPLPGEPREVPKDLAKGIIIPSRGITVLRNIKATGVIVFCLAGNHLLIATADEKLYFRLIDGEFPDYEKVIPGYLTGKAECKRLALIEALERCRILSDNKMHRTRLGFGEGAIAISSELLEFGQAADQVTADVQIEPFDLYVNADYLIETLESMDCSLVEINCKDGISPIRINPLGTDEPLAVIMPQRA